MRHRDRRQRLTQKPAHARMLKRNLATSLFLYESVRTTLSRARAVQPIIDRLVTIAKKRPTHVAIRQINQVVTDKNASRKIIEVLAKRYENRSSGLTRVVAAGSRNGDGAKLVDITLIDAQIGIVEEEKKPAKKKAPASATKKTVTTDEKKTPETTKKTPSKAKKS